MAAAHFLSGYLVHLVSLVHLVHLVDLVSLVGLVQPNNRDRPNRRDRPDRPNRPDEQDGLAHFFSILPDCIRLAAGEKRNWTNGNVGQAPRA